MKKQHNSKFYVLILIFAIFVVQLKANLNSLTLDLNLRYRFELWEGMNAKNYGDESPNAIGKLDDKLLLQRIIIGCTYQLDRDNSLGFHIQDSRAFNWSISDSKYPDLFKVRKKGTAEPYYKMNPSEEFFEIYDLFFESKNIIEKLNVKIGRQKIFYGDYRIFGPGDWGNTGRWTWDAVKLDYKDNDYWLSAFAGGTKIHDPNYISLPFTNTEYYGGGFYSNIKLAQNAYIEPFASFKFRGSANFISNQSINRYWLGTRLLKEKINNFLLDASIIYEFGNDNGKQISAYGYALKAGYQFDLIPTKPLLYARRSFASGPKINSSQINTFEPAFGASDKFYGWMNIVQWSNLDDWELVLELNPAEGWWIENKINFFYIPEPSNYSALSNLIVQENQNFLGYEIDIFSKYIYNKNLEFVGVVGYFEPREVKAINNKTAKSAIYVALQIIFKDNFLLF